jgi:2'-5' RNA ligase
LPNDCEERLKHWADATPSASLAPWGSHITLIRPFEIKDSWIGPSTVIQKIRNVCTATQPIDVCLNRVAVHRHLYDQNLHIVMLQVKDQSVFFHQIVQFRRALIKSIESLVVFENKDRIDYKPHLSLTLGISQHEAYKVMASAQQAKLVLCFQLDQIWLFKHEASQEGPQTLPVERFKLNSSF